ncbi:uncharacterized protein LOC126355666 [Schistocerca gregaria]|uniref:uncharacterized protein LOC126355666 n=1 Tax=Schistocerca gregaria TaxID=7010 RepID=UPI00211F1A60|nr:uncharacterized protein LOC126355666 [Schistocerca gregaria]
MPVDNLQIPSRPPTSSASSATVPACPTASRQPPNPRPTTHQQRLVRHSSGLPHCQLTTSKSPADHPPAAPRPPQFRLAPLPVDNLQIPGRPSTSIASSATVPACPTASRQPTNPRPTTHQQRLVRHSSGLPHCQSTTSKSPADHPPAAPRPPQFRLAPLPVGNHQIPGRPPTSSASSATVPASPTASRQPPNPRPTTQQQRLVRHSSGLPHCQSATSKSPADDPPAAPRPPQFRLAPLPVYNL